MSLGRLREEESPFRFEKILWWQVGEGRVSVGEEDEAGAVEALPVRGEGTPGDLRTVRGKVCICVAKVRSRPPLTPTEDKR